MAEKVAPNAEMIYRDATFSAATRAKLELAYNILSATCDVHMKWNTDDEVDWQGAVDALRDVLDRWDNNDATETVFP